MLTELCPYTTIVIELVINTVINQI
jgi:hypothetical protein